MNIVVPPIIGRKALTDQDFNKLSAFVTANYGIKLPMHKKVMVEGRLQKRLKEKSIETFKEYVDMVLGDKESAEMIEMINAISTNKTDFFREPAHFDYMSNHVLPQFVSDNLAGKLKIWSAAASTGEEIYTLAMVIEEYKREHNAGRLDYSILGTDISVQVLEKAICAVYHTSRIVNLSLEMKKRYFLKSKDALSNNARIKPMLRAKTKFGRLNLIDDRYPVDEKFDIIFCRNVLIYFDRETQEEVVRKLSQKLNKGGYLFLGHSESLCGKHSELKSVKPTIYRKES